MRLCRQDDHPQNTKWCPSHRKITWRASKLERKRKICIVIPMVSEFSHVHLSAIPLGEMRTCTFCGSRLRAWYLLVGKSQPKPYWVGGRSRVCHVIWEGFPNLRHHLLKNQTVCNENGHIGNKPNHFSWLILVVREKSGMVILGITNPSLEIPANVGQWPCHLHDPNTVQQPKIGPPKILARNPWTFNPKKWPKKLPSPEICRFTRDPS